MLVFRELCPEVVQWIRNNFFKKVDLQETLWAIRKIS